MGIMDLAAQVMGKTDAISRESARTPEEVKSALQQGIKLIPEILASKDKGISILNGLGMDKTFISEMYQRFGSRGSKVGLSDTVIRNAVGVIESKLSQKENVMRSPVQSPVKSPVKSSGFDRSRYPLVK